MAVHVHAMKGLPPTYVQRAWLSGNTGAMIAVTCPPGVLLLRRCDLGAYAR